MKKRHYLFLSAVIALLAVFFVQKARSDEYSEGKVIFESRCEVCHVIQGNDHYISTYHRDFRPKDFSKSISWEGLTADKIRFVLHHGKGVMHPIRLTEAETNELIAYMTKVLKKQAENN